MSLSFLLAHWGSPGNLAPLLTAARRLGRRGHNVRFIGPADIQQEVKDAGFGFTGWNRAPSYSERDNMEAMAASCALAMVGNQVMFGPAAEYAADTMNELMDEPTDALLAHNFLFGAALAAEAANVPCALLSPHVSLRLLPGVPPVASGLLPPRNAEERVVVDAASLNLGSIMNEWLPTLNKARGLMGLRPLGHVFEQYDRVDRVLLAMSDAFDFPAECLPDNVRYVGPLLDPPTWSHPWQPPWPTISDQPRVLVSFSTGFQGQAGVLQRVISALGRIDLDAVVTTGPAMVGETLIAPPNVTLVHSAPHDLVMAEVSVVITQGGHGTVTRALAHGVPLLIMPMGRDQGDNALRVASRGAGLTLAEDAAEAEIAASVTRLVLEPQFRSAARRLGRAIAPSIRSAAIVTEMEKIAMGVWRLYA